MACLPSKLYDSLHSRRQGEGNLGERERTPAIKTPFFSFLRMLTATKSQTANSRWEVNIVNPCVKSAIHVCESTCQFLIGEHIDS